MLVLDNLEERQFFGIPSGATLNSSHFRIAVKCVAKLHAVGICHKMMLLHTFQQQEAAALSKKTCEDVEVDGNKVAELRDGQFVGEMSFLTEKSATATCVVKHPTKCLVWKQQEFKDLLKRNPSLYFTIQSLLSAQVSNNLVSSSKK